MTLNELTNNQKRKEFLDKYTGWNLWLAVPEVSEKYYSYPLPDNTMIIVKETERAKGDDWWKKDERGGYYVTTEYYLLEGDWKRFADCKKSMTQIIEHERGETMIDVIVVMGVGVLIGAFGVIAWALSAVNKDRGEKDDRDQAGKGNGPESH